MNKKNSLFNIYLIALFILTGSSFVKSQQNINIDSEFNLAVSYYESGEYSDALEIFKKISINLPYNSKTTAAYLFVGKTYLQMNDTGSAEQYLRDFLNKYPTSEYTDEAKLALVKVFYSREDYNRAFEYIINLIESAKLSGYKNYAASLGEDLALNFIDTPQLESYGDTISVSSLKPYFSLLIGEKSQSEGNYNLAVETYQDLIDNYPGSEQVDKAKKLINQIKNKKQQNTSETLLAVLLPLHNEKTGEKISAADEILEGIKFATSKYNSEHSNKVGLIIRDTGNDSLKIDLIKDEINTIPSVKAVIGPIFSNEVRYTLEDFKYTGIPVISPTATDNDLVGLSEYFFQANPSFSMRGKVIAQYIYYVTGIKNMGVLNAAQGYSTLLADSFINEFEKGTING